MTQKRALIVDDSKSARVVLSKLLEKYDLEVHSTESAEEAITHLQVERPDVIFMDHLMPDMDGFQAVQAIKNDPRTAKIPILMYTSQGGELYMSQARALGAIGVLPKQLGLTDVAKVLHQLHLLPQPREDAGEDGQQILKLPGVAPECAAGGEVTGDGAAQPQDVPVAAGGVSEATTSASQPTPPAPPVMPQLTAREVREALEPLFSAQSTELRRFLLATLDSVATRPAPPPPAPAPPAAAPRPARSAPWPALCALLLALLAGLGYYALQLRTRLAAAEARPVTDTPVVEPRGSQGAAATDSPAPAAATPEAAATPAAANAVAEVPAPPARQLLPYAYGELPLSGARLEALQALIEAQRRRGASGIVRVTSYAADYCLTGNPTEGYVAAPADMPSNRCDVVGNPFDEARSGARLASQAFTAYLASLAAAPAAGITVETAHVRHAHPVTAYPTDAEAPAAQWNDAAVANQVVELRFEPRAGRPAP